MTTHKHIIFGLLMSLTGLATAQVQSLGFNNGELYFTYKEGEQPKINNGVPELYSGQKVHSPKTQMDGVVGNSIMLLSEDENKLGFNTDNIKVTRIGGGYWLLTFPARTNLLEKKHWLDEQKGVKRSKIEIIQDLYHEN